MTVKENHFYVELYRNADEASQRSMKSTIVSGIMETHGRCAKYYQFLYGEAYHRRDIDRLIDEILCDDDIEAMIDVYFCLKKIDQSVRQLEVVLCRCSKRLHCVKEKAL